MESSPEDSLPPLHSFNSRGDPIDVVLYLTSRPLTQRTRSLGPLPHLNRLRSRTVRPSTRLHARHNITSSDRCMEPFPNQGRVRGALDNVRRLEYAGGETSSQDSFESLLWDSAAKILGDSFDNKHLWSSSTTSTHFDVTIVKSESVPNEMATNCVEISDQDLLDANKVTRTARADQSTSVSCVNRHDKCLQGPNTSATNLPSQHHGNSWPAD